MNDFNAPGSNKSWINDGFKEFIVEQQLSNIVNILGGELKRYTCIDKSTTHQKIVIEYNHKKK